MAVDHPPQVLRRLVGCYASCRGTLFFDKMGFTVLFLDFYVRIVPGSTLRFLWVCRTGIIVFSTFVGFIGRYTLLNVFIHLFTTW